MRLTSALIALSLAAASAASPSCKNDKGDDVDWYVVMKGVSFH